MASEAPKLKDYFTPAVVAEIGERLRAHYPSLDLAAFTDHVMQPADGEPFDALAFTARSRRIADAIEATVDLDPVAMFELLVQSLPAELDGSAGTLNDGFMLWPYGDVIGRHGSAHPTEALTACYELTKRFTAEFAIRPILADHPSTLETLASWAEDPNEHVRRLVSEGTRPRLPWAQRLALPLEPVVALLRTLRADDSAYVRKSVANHLNDLAKDHPDRIIELLASWHDEGHPHTQWIVRHALRNHLKAGTPAALQIYGYEPPQVTIAGLAVAPAAAAIGDAVECSFAIESTSGEPQLLMIDLVMGYRKANGSLSPKVFKFRELTIDGHQSVSFAKGFDMVVRSTRKLYPGEHSLAVRVNGVDLAETTFDLAAADAG
jgi:3-methyladenine DNA glycosylase AlkC